MSKLLTYCRRCRHEVPVQACDLSGLCVICLTSDAVAVDKADYQRLWKKFRGCERKGVDCTNVKEQLARVARRLGDKVHARIGNPQQAIAILNAHLEDARNVVERGSARPRIVLPTAGAMLAKNNPLASAGLLHA
jgi:hypothetical protein